MQPGLSSVELPLQRLPFRQLWPLALLLGAELLALVSVATWSSPGPTALITPFSLGIAGLILACGLLPALLRPSTETLLTGCLTTIIASFMAIPVRVTDLPTDFMNQRVLDVVPPHILVRLVNSACLGPLAFHLAARFPRRSNISSRRLAAAYVITITLLIILLLTNVTPVRQVTMVGLVIWLPGLLIAALGLILKASRDTSPENQRAAQQARLLFFTLLLAETLALLRPVGFFLRAELIPFDLVLAAQILLPLGLTYAVLRHDLFEIDAALRRALAYGALSILLITLYLGITVALTAVSTRLSPTFKGAAVLLSLLIAAAIFEPTRRRVQSAIDRAFYPDRLNFQREINQAQAALARVVNRQEVIRLLTQELPPRIGVTWANLSLAPAPEVPGQPDLQPAWNTRLIVAGQPLGRYWLGPRRAGPSFDRDEQAQLQSLARQAALALAYADTIEELNQLNQELEERVAQRTTQVLSQQRALAVYEERQRLARNLHDSVTQALFSINLSARALRNLVRRDPSAAVNGLNDLEIAAQQALAEMRALLAQLRAPQGLDNAESAGEPTNLPRADLCAPLRQHCQALQSQPSPLHVEIDLPETLFLPAPQADDLLYIVREALHNIIKHSGSDHALCRIIVEAEQLTLAITDQGEGFDPQALVGNGYGLRGMQERAEALGGRLKINSQAGVGTAISIQIPYRSNL